MPRNVLESYLSRAVTHLGLCAGHPEGRSQFFESDLAMLENVGAKFVGRAAYAWGTPPGDDRHFEQAEARAKRVHEMDPEIILQACVFEIVDTRVENIEIPAWVFEAFDLDPEERTFRFEEMVYDDGWGRNRWGPSSGVPDMSRLETRMWFFYRAARYIDAGYEALHLGQFHLMNRRDPGFGYWDEVLERIRGYARENARRGMVLCDAHAGSGAAIEDEESGEDRLLFDFLSFPLRPKELVEEPQKAILKEGHLGDGYGGSYLGSIYGRTIGGVTPSGWPVSASLYIVEFDNFGGLVQEPGQPNVNHHSVWGYDEIAWFARQSERYRNEFLNYAWNWIRENDPHGWLQFPARRTLGNAPVEREFGSERIQTHMYRANTQSKDVPVGFNQEKTIKAIWEADG
ncbi:MAG: hypothetical protein ACLFU6_10550 [Candidatus Hydrogenedentota bacterium]